MIQNNLTKVAETEQVSRRNSCFEMAYMQRLLQAPHDTQLQRVTIQPNDPLTTNEQIQYTLATLMLTVHRVHTHDSALNIRSLLIAREKRS